ncbi:Amidase 1 [Hibiscus syriacus]|uniref:Amidase 1 n=1 Tax=Hibiscus syriacus TaxID=106335 RepID=A0A6A2ZAS7_HIBSY|nr:Amidase 1 [Hibiscus syriacus]
MEEPKSLGTLHLADNYLSGPTLWCNPCKYIEIDVLELLERGIQQFNGGDSDRHSTPKFQCIKFCCCLVSSWRVSYKVPTRFRENASEPCSATREIATGTSYTSDAAGFACTFGCTPGVVGLNSTSKIQPKEESHQRNYSPGRKELIMNIVATVESGETSMEYGAFMEKFILQPNSSSQQLPLSGLTFAVKEMFDVEGHVTGFGNPDWKRTHSASESTAPTVVDVLMGGATCVGRTGMDEMSYRVLGGSSSGSAVAVGAGLVDFSLGTDTGGSVKVPASYCGILGFRPSHDVVSTSGVIRCHRVSTLDPVVLNRVRRVLLHLPNMDPVAPNQIIFPEDCFGLSAFRVIEQLKFSFLPLLILLLSKGGGFGLVSVYFIKPRTPEFLLAEIRKLVPRHFSIRLGARCPKTRRSKSVGIVLMQNFGYHPGVPDGVSAMLGVYELRDAESLSRTMMPTTD